MRSENDESSLFLELSLHKCREQAAAFRFMQARAQQIFSMAAVIIGILSTFLISPRVGWPAIPRWTLCAIFALFILLTVMCMLVLGAKSWRAGPQLDKLETALPGVQEQHPVAIWIGRQMNIAYKSNLRVQTCNALYLNAAVFLLVLLIGVMLLSAWLALSGPAAASSVSSVSAPEVSAPVSADARHVFPRPGLHQE